MPTGRNLWTAQSTSFLVEITGKQWGEWLEKQMAADLTNKSEVKNDLAAARAQIVSLLRARGTVFEKAKKRRVPRPERRHSEMRPLQLALRHASKIAALGVPVVVTVQSGDLRVDLRTGPAAR